MTQKDRFYQAVFLEQSPALARTFFEASSGLFTPSKSGKARLEALSLPASDGLVNTAEAGSNHTVVSQSSPPLVEGPRETAPSFETEIIKSIIDLEEHAHDVDESKVYFISQRNSYSALTTSADLYNGLSRLRRISPQFRDYFLYFGERESEIEIAPPAIRFRSGGKPSPSKASWTECLCGIRFVEPNSRTDVDEPSSRWSLRQCAVYYRIDSVSVGQTWVFVTVSEACKHRLHMYFSGRAQSRDTDVFEVLILLIDTVLGNWRPYIVAINTETEQHAVQLLGASPDNRGPIGMGDSGQRQTLMLLDDKMGNSLQVLKATKDDVYILLQQRLRLLPDDGADDTILLALNEALNEIDRLTLRIDALRSRLAGIANLVSSFLDLSNGFALQQLGKESRRENLQMRVLSQRMHQLAERNTQDAAAIKVLTILTLLYLPLTVVINFFSTSFIGTAGNRIYVTDDWWILVSVAVPLTAVTLYVWWVWMRIKAYGIMPWWWSRRFNRSGRVATASETNRGGIDGPEGEPSNINRANTEFYD